MADLHTLASAALDAATALERATFALVDQHLALLDLDDPGEHQRYYLGEAAHNAAQGLTQTLAVLRQLTPKT